MIWFALTLIFFHCSHLIKVMGEILIYIINLHYDHFGEKAMAHSSTLAWKIPWMEEPGRLQSMGSLRVGHDWSDFTFTFHFHALEKEMATHSSTLAWRIPGAEEPGGLLSMGSHRVGHDWSDLACMHECMTIFIVIELMVLNCGVGEDFWESLGLRGDSISSS